MTGESNGFVNDAKYSVPIFFEYSYLAVAFVSFSLRIARAAIGTARHHVAHWIAADDARRPRTKWPDRSWRSVNFAQRSKNQRRRPEATTRWRDAIHDQLRDSLWQHENSRPRVRRHRRWMYIDRPMQCHRLWKNKVVQNTRARTFNVLNSTSANFISINWASIKNTYSILIILFYYLII